MRFPRRIRGLVLGAVTLVAGPVIAASLTQPAPRSAPTIAALPAAAMAVNDGREAVRLVRLPLVSQKHALPPPATPHRTTTRRVSIPAGPVNRNSVAGIIMSAAARWGVSGSWMVSIARCESGLNPHAYNPRGPYYGLFQFLMSTFTHNGGTSIWDPADQANIAAKMLAHGQAHQWACA